MEIYKMHISIFLKNKNNKLVLQVTNQQNIHSQTIKSRVSKQKTQFKKLEKNIKQN